MTYVRTNYKIVGLRNVDNNTIDMWYGKEIRRSQNMLDLCDCYACNNTIYSTLEEALNKNPNYKNIYGCIWTEDGLMYATELTSNGSLQLFGQY